MSTEYKIENLFLQAFGLKVSDNYQVKTDKGAKEPKKGVFGNIGVVDNLDDEATMYSQLGTPILHPVTFIGGAYKKYNNSGELVTVKKGDFLLPTSCIIGMSRSKIMTQTPINGGRGSVKEIYGFENWNITINGFLIPDEMQPQNFKRIDQQEHELCSWDELASAVEVQSDVLNSKGIMFLSIIRISFEPVRGKPKVRLFTITCESDDPIELNINSQVGI